MIKEKVDKTIIIAIFFLPFMIYAVVYNIYQFTKAEFFPDGEVNITCLKYDKVNHICAEYKDTTYKISLSPSTERPIHLYDTVSCYFYSRGAEKTYVDCKIVGDKIFTEIPQNKILYVYRKQNFSDPFEKIITVPYMTFYVNLFSEKDKVSEEISATIRITTTIKNTI